MSIDLFETRSMLASLDERRGPRTYLRDTFFGRNVPSQTENIDIDIRRNKRRLAPFVHPLAEGKKVDRQGFITKSFKPPYIKEKMVTTALDVLTRGMGQNPYSASSPAERAAQIAAEDLVELQDMIDRRIEWMVAQILLTGSVTVTGEGLNAVVSFGRSNSHTVTLASGVKWSQAGGTPIDDLRAWKRLVSQDSGVVPNRAIVGYDVMETLLENDQFTANIERFSNQTATVAMTADGLPEGITYVGRIEGLDIFNYEEWYLDDAGVEQPLVPADKVILGSTRSRAAVHFGAIKDLEAGGLAAVPYFPKSWRTPDPSAQWLLLQSAPLPVPLQVDAFLAADVL